MQPQVDHWWLCAFSGIFWCKHGPAFGYFPKPSKTFLVIKSGCHADAAHLFTNTGVQLTEDRQDFLHEEGQRHLGAAIGSDEFVASYIDQNVASWVTQVDQLAAIAATYPHAAYASFVFGLRHHWTF